MNDIESPDDLLTRKQATAYLTKIGYPVSPQTLANLAVNNNSGHGPSFIRSGVRIVRYKRGALDAWARLRVQHID